jgi:RHS repeat-associated protein
MAHLDVAVSLSSSAASNCQRDSLPVLSHGVRAVALTILLLPVLLGVARPQNDPVAGVQPFSTNSFGIDLATSNINLSIPLRSKLTGSISLVSNSSAYLNGGTPSRWAVGTPLSSVDTAIMGYTFAYTGSVPDGECVVDGLAMPDTTYFGFYVTDGTGAQHSLGALIMDQYGCRPPAASVMATDGSGLTVVTESSNDWDNWIVYDRSGMHNGITPDGVLLTAGGGGTYTDALSSTAVLTGSLHPGTSTPDTYSYYDASDTQRTITVSKTGYYQWTAFGCTGIPDMDGSTLTYFPTMIALPTGASYGITYEQTPGKSSSYVTGRIASITYPSGGSISYAYSGGNNGIICGSSVVPTITVTVNDGKGNKGQYTFANSSATVTETDPAGNQTVYTFGGEYQIQAQYYEGSATGTPLETVVTCYNANFTNCAASGPGALPITQTDVYTSLNGSSSNLVETKFDGLGNTTEVKRYDFGAAMPPTGNPLSDTLTYYGQSWNGTSCTAYPSGTYIQNTPCYSYTKNSAGTTVSQTQITYSNTGHPTSTVKLTGASSLTSTATYNSNGTVATATDVNGALYTYAYNGTDGCNSLLATSVTVTGAGLPSAGLTTSTEWDCNGSVVTSTTDPNGAVTATNYVVGGVADPLYRPLSAVDPLVNTTNLSYSTTTLEGATNFNGTTSTSDKLATTDGLGRPIFAQTRQAQGSSTFDSTQITYGWASSTGACITQSPFTNGACTVQSVPYSGSAGQSAPSGTAVTTTQYDALGRPLTVTDGGGGATSYQHIQNDVLQSVGPTPIFQKQLEYDGLGRLTSVCEITSASGSGPCGQSNMTTGFLTKYTYDALGNLLTVAQNAQPGAIGGTQTRSYTYDGLSRLTSEQNPETGTITYTYDTDVTCGTSKGDLVKKIDAVGNVICLAYDALHRVTSVTYPSGSYAASTPAKTFIYDATTFGCTSPNVNVKGRLGEAFTGPSTAKITDIAYCYSPRGETTDTFESTPNSGGYYHTTASYWANGALETLGGVPGLSGWTFSVDGEGRPFSATYNASTPIDWVTNTTYYPSNPATTVTFGDSDTDVYSYDATTGRMNQFQFTVRGTTTESLTGAVGWNANRTLGSLAITDGFTPAHTQTCSYGYDALARISSVGCVNSSNTTIWTQSFIPDAFGNLSKSGTTTFAASYLLANGTTNNQEQSVASCVPTYDANGNLTKDCTNSDVYAWNADGRPTTLNGEGITYDALDRRVEIASGSTYTQVLYSPIGKLGLMSGQTLKTIRIPLPGGSTAELVGNASTRHILHSDWLGSARLSTTYTAQTVANDVSYAPYGESYDGTSTDLNFTGQSQDTLTGLYDFLYREYSPVQGRWISPDPAGLAAVDPSNPQSWNRYAYVLNNPLANIDPLGLWCVWEDGTHDDDPNNDGNAAQDECAAQGGHWDQYDTITGIFQDGEGNVPNQHNLRKLQCFRLGHDARGFRSDVVFRSPK